MSTILFRPQCLNTLRLRQNGRHFADATLKCFFLYESIWILVDISLKFVPRIQINNIPSLVQIMAWRQPGDKPLSEPMIVRLPMHICITRPRRVKTLPSQTRPHQSHKNQYHVGWQLMTSWHEDQGHQLESYSRSWCSIFHCLSWWQHDM